MIQLSNTNLIKWGGMVFVLVVLLSATLTSVPDYSDLNISNETWTKVSTPQELPSKRSFRRLQRLSLWGSEESEAEESAGDERIKAGKDGIRRVAVSWIFKGVVINASEPYVLIEEKKGSDARAFKVGDILPGGERLQSILLDTLLFSLPEKEAGAEAEISLESKSDTALTENFSRQLYAPITALSVSPR